MKKLTGTLLFILSVLVMSGCNSDKGARKLIRHFIETEMQVDDADVQQWSDVDSTFFVSDSLIRVMRANGASYVRPQTVYNRPTAKLHYVRVTYATEKDTVTQTFYIDDGLAGIVGFKTDRVIPVIK